VPPTIAGLVEVFGVGPMPICFEPEAVIDLVIRLVPADTMQRMPDEGSETIEGCVLPVIDVAQCNVAAALPAIVARLKIPPFRLN
jgi:serine kinase of HPr protein (carbohydrate metabolism regulator)